MKVRVIDESHEEDLENEINEFLEEEDVKVIDIKFSTSSFSHEQEQIYCFSAMIIYE